MCSGTGGDEEAVETKQEFMSLFYVNQTPCSALGLSQSLEMEFSSRNKVKVGRGLLLVTTDDG